MSTTIIETPVSATNSALSEKALAWIAQEAEKTTPELRTARIIELTAQHIASQQNRKKTPFQDFQGYASAETELLKRVYFIKEVMRNTLRKMTHGNPEHFDWAKSYTGKITQIGFFRKSRSHKGLDTIDITTLPANYVFKDADVIRFTHLNTFTKKETVVVLPAMMLRQDPILIAQMVRKECRDFAATKEYKERVAKNAEIAEAQKKLESLEKELFALQTRKPMKTVSRLKPKKVQKKIA